LSRGPMARQWRPCTPASGWEKGRVENQVGTIRERLFSPRVRVKSMEELNDRLLDQCVTRAKVQPHPEIADKTVWEVFEAERARLVPYRCRFDGFHAVQARDHCSRTNGEQGRALQDLPRALRQQQILRSGQRRRPPGGGSRLRRSDRASPGRAGGRRACPRLGRGGTVYNPWHYVPVLARKPGALRNGAPFKHWVLPAAIERARRKLRAMPDGDRQMVEILGAVLSDGLPAVEAACAEALKAGVHSAEVILNILARRRDPGPPITIMTPEALRLTCAPIADCHRYDSLRRAI
jgi:hypothetical protein